MGLVALQHVGSSQTRDRTGILCIGRWILNHLTPPPRKSHLVLSCEFPLLFSYNRKSSYLGVKEPRVPICETAKETQMYSLLDSVGEGKGGMV